MFFHAFLFIAGMYPLRLKFANRALVAGNENGVRKNLTGSALLNSALLSAPADTAAAGASKTYVRVVYLIQGNIMCVDHQQCGVLYAQLHLLQK